MSNPGRTCSPDSLKIETGKQVSFTKSVTMVTDSVTLNRLPGSDVSWSLAYFSD